MKDFHQYIKLIEKRVKQDSDIKDREGSQPAKYYAKDAEGDEMSKSTKDARARHFEKGAKKDDDDPEAYKPAPGDSSAKTKPSKHTKKFQQTFGEAVTQRQIQDLEKFGDRLLAKFDIDIEFTRHFADRMNDTRNNPEISVSEIQRLFKKIHDNKGVNIKKNPNSEVVLKDMQADLNLPVVINYRNGEFEVVNKTIMRKKNFKTSNRVIKYEGFKDYIEKTLEESADKSLKDKAEKTGISFSILKQVYNRGVAAWRTGHRPGTTPEQWGHARVNSFATGGKTRTTADADLWKKHKGT